MPPSTLTPTASGSHTRVQMQRDGQAFIPHGTVQTYDPTTGAFTAFMDFQPMGEAPYTFTPDVQSTSVLTPRFTDQNGLTWSMIR